MGEVFSSRREERSNVKMKGILSFMFWIQDLHMAEEEDQAAFLPAV